MMAPNGKAIFGENNEIRSRIDTKAIWMAAISDGNFIGILNDFRFAVKASPNNPVKASIPVKVVKVKCGFCCLRKFFLYAVKNRKQPSPSSPDQPHP
jgi:hypothetical protein